MSQHLPLIEQEPLVQHPVHSSHAFGESEFGPRLQYQKPPYRDLVFAIIFTIHLIIVTFIGCFLWATQYQSIQSSAPDAWDYDVPITGVFIGILFCALSGILIGLLWLIIMKRYPSTIIKTMLFLNIATWIIITVVGVITNDITLIIIGAIISLIYILWTWCIWRNIPFSSVLLSISSRITSKFGNGSIFLALVVIVLDLIWIFIWGSCFTVYLLTASNPSGFIIFLLIVSLYWTIQVNQNIGHTTTCGVAAAWYFTTEMQLNERSPTYPALKRTMTTSFGSVCFGSLIVAILQAIRAMIQTSQDRGHELLRCLCLCLLDCIERAVRWFNKYAFAHCAIYGTSYITSAKNTWCLFETRGIMALINDDLTGLAIFGGALIGGCVCCAIGYAVGYLFYGDYSEYEVRTDLPIGLAVYGFFIGLIICFTVLYVVHSAIICLFVCYSEDPAVMEENHANEYHRICDAKPAFGQIHRPPPRPQQNL
eukprot:25463_1